MKSKVQRLHAVASHCLVMLFVLCVQGCHEQSVPAPSDSTTKHTPVAAQTDLTMSEPTDFSSHRSNESAWFDDVTAASGIDFVHVSGDSPEKPFPAANGSGLGMIDFDLDGWQDLMFLTGTPFPINASRKVPRNRIYRNRGELHFEDVTDQTGLGHTGFSAGLAVGDFDNDGFPDVSVTCFGANQMYLNQGDGTFKDVGAQAGVSHAQWGTSAACLDFDNDGFLDLYVCNYGKWSLETNPFCGDQARSESVLQSSINRTRA